MRYGARDVTVLGEQQRQRQVPADLPPTRRRHQVVTGDTGDVVVSFMLRFVFVQKTILSWHLIYSA